MSEYWRLQAACREADPTLFFDVAHEGRRDRAARVREALTLCADCPVRKVCGDFGRTQEEGIWGGKMHRPERIKYASRASS